VRIRVYPGQPGSGFAFDNHVVGEAIPREFIPAIELGLREAASAGVPDGCPVEDVRIAAITAFQDAVRNAGPVVDRFDDDTASPVRQPRHPVPAPRDSAVALPEPDDTVDDNGI
jgi:elongation factor G